MEKDRSSKVIAIVALVVAVLGLSLGFAAFSQQLTINPEATVKGDKSQFSVKFSTQEESAQDGQVEPTLDPGTGEISDFKAEEATIAATTISNLKATFVNGKGTQKVTYSFNVYNDGALTAYLKKVNFDAGKPECSSAAENGATSELVTAACNDVKVKVNVHDTDYEVTTPNITTKSIASKNGVPITVELSYDGDAHPVDGDFTVDFGSITLDYSSADGE